MKRLKEFFTPDVGYLSFWLVLVLFYVVFFGLVASSCNAQGVKNIFKYSTMYAAVNGGTSLGDDQIWSITSGILEEDVIETPFDYTFSVGIRKIKRLDMRIEPTLFTMVLKILTLMPQLLVELMVLNIYLKLIL